MKIHARDLIPDWSFEDEEWRRVSLHNDVIFEPESGVSLEVESQYETGNWKSFWCRALRPKPYGSKTLQRQSASREDIPWWIDDVGIGAKDVKFTMLFIFLCCIWHVLLYVVSLFSHLHGEFKELNCSHQSSVKIWEIVVARVMLIPHFHSFSMWAHTNLRGFRGRKFWWRIAVIWIVYAAYTTIYHFTWSKYACGGRDDGLEPWNSGAVNISFLLLRTILMLLLVRLLRLEWRITIGWLLVTHLYWNLFLIFCKVKWIPSGESECESIRVTTKSVFVWMPILTMVYEYGTKCPIARCFRKFQDNDVGISWLILTMLFNPELMRSLSFILVFLDWSPGNFILNALCSLIGEIWTHTQVGRLCRNEVSIRLLGTTADNFPNLHKLVGSSRSHLEYIAPVWFISALYFDFIWGPRPGLNQVYEKKWFIMGAYLLQEFVAEVICCVIRKSSGYKRLAAVGHLKFHVQLMIVVTSLVFYDILGCLDTLQVLLA